MSAKKESINKPSAKAVSPKKTSTKKTTKRAAAKKKVFIEIPEDKFFILINGDKLKHYVELADKLESLENYVIHHHITPFRHDFANWIKDVFDEEELAEKLSKINEPEKIRSAIYKHIINKHLK